MVHNCIPVDVDFVLVITFFVSCLHNAAAVNQNTNIVLNVSAYRILYENSNSLRPLHTARLYREVLFFYIIKGTDLNFPTCKFVEYFLGGY